MDPLFILQATGFRASSGNQVVRVIDLGDDGMNPIWRRRPTAEDKNEFQAWALTKLSPGTELDVYEGGAGQAGIEKSRQAYAVWKKSSRAKQ